MHYFIIPILVAVALVFAHVLRKSAQKASALKQLRMEMFETIGAEWITLINAELTDSSVQRSPSKKTILEIYFPKKNIWIISIPLVDSSYGDFDMLLGVSLVSDPDPQAKSILAGLIITTDLRSWWSKDRNSPVHNEVMEKLSKIGRYFDIADSTAL